MTADGLAHNAPQAYCHKFKVQAAFLSTRQAQDSATLWLLMNVGPGSVGLAVCKPHDLWHMERGEREATLWFLDEQDMQNFSGHFNVAANRSRLKTASL